jgi:2-oxoisovalerate dehydrogenase E1 component alpha subunit
MLSRVSCHFVRISLAMLDIWLSWAHSSGKSSLKGVALTPLARPGDATPAAGLLPTVTPLQLIGQDGQAGANPGDLSLPGPGVLLGLHRAMVLGRRFDTQATALTRQGRLAVYPSSRGQDACQAGAALALRSQDWLFPTYRDSVAIVTRGVPAEQALTLLRGDWHCGYDPREHRVAPQCTPLATNTLHAVGLAQAARLRMLDEVALVLLGDGATSEGDTHEALNFAAVWKSPVVFLVQNNGYAISVPLAKQTAAPSLAAKGIGYGIPSMLIDGNDAAAVYASVRAAIEHASGGGGPTLIEAITYRIEAHTNADDATRYRAGAEVGAWLARDPIARLEAWLRAGGLLDDEGSARLAAEAGQLAADVRQRLNADVTVDPADLFDHVYAQPTATLERQRARLLAELPGQAGFREPAS